MGSECQIGINNNIHHSTFTSTRNVHISTWPVNTLGGNSFVKGSTIIRSVLACSIDTLCL